MHRKATYYFLFAGLALVIASGIFLLSATPASAQCGSQASSCKNCHEVQGKDPVNADGTGWHQSHSFGDFCYICHAGNQQATDEATAHQGMVDPLSDVEAACQQCHVADLQERAQVYADTLGVDVGTGSTGAEQPVAPATSSESTIEETSAPAAVPAVDYNDPNLVNYSQDYDQQVLGKYPTNWGNVILIIMIVMLLLGGGYLVLTREKLIHVTFADPGVAADAQKYPADAIALLPDIAKLSASDRKDLHKVLGKPGAVKALLVMINELIK
jgi:cytochrome c553